MIEAELVPALNMERYCKASPNSQRAVDEAENNGLDVVFPADDELLIDIDDEAAFEVYQKHFDIIKQHLGVTSEVIKPSRSGLPKRHITVKLDNVISMAERIALQACLGSDRLREVLGYVQYKNDDPHPVLFLENRAPITEGVQ